MFSVSIKIDCIINLKIIDFIKFSYKVNCTVMGDVYSDSTITCILDNADNKHLSDNDLELVRLIKLFILYKDSNTINTYIDSIYL